MDIYFEYNGLPYQMRTRDLATNSPLPPGARIITEKQAIALGTRIADASTLNIPQAVAPLTFKALREINVERCNLSFFPLESKDGPWWGNAMAGECGEACNVVKKLERDGETPEMLIKLKHELADVVTYADLLAARYGINLGQAVAEKFNIVSQRRGSHLKIPVEE